MNEKSLFWWNEEEKKKNPHFLFSSFSVPFAWAIFCQGSKLLLKMPKENKEKSQKNGTSVGDKLVEKLISIIIFSNKLRVKNIYEKLSCFEITAFFHAIRRWGKKSVISKQESFSSSLNRSYIVFTLVAYSTTTITAPAYYLANKIFIGFTKRGTHIPRSFCNRKLLNNSCSTY